jgi:hypothetical protein
LLRQLQQPRGGRGERREHDVGDKPWGRLSRAGWRPV